MRRSLPASLLVLALCLPAVASAQMGGGGPPMPMAIELKKAPVGSWAQYSMTVGEGMNMKSRVALVKRDANEIVLEMGVEGGPMAAMGAGKMVMKMVMAPDPSKTDKPIKQMIMQMGDQDPMEMPAEMASRQQKFEKPDPKKLVGKESVKLAGKSFKTSHYRDTTEHGTVDFWVSEEAPPFGMVKMTSTPKPGAAGPNGQPIPPMTMEIIAQGKDAKPTITKPAKPFNPAALFGGGGHMGPAPGAHPGPPPGGVPPAAPGAK